MNPSCQIYLAVFAVAAFTQCCLLDSRKMLIPKGDAAWGEVTPGDTLVAIRDMEVFMTTDTRHLWIDYDGSYAKDFDPALNMRYGKFRKGDSIVAERLLATHAVDYDNLSYYCRTKGGIEISIDEAGIVGMKAGFRVIKSAATHSPSLGMSESRTSRRCRPATAL